MSSSSSKSEKTDNGSSFFSTYKYKLLAGTYLSITALLCHRVHRQPYAPAIKWEQYEAIFKGTSLSAVVGGMVMSNGGQRRYKMYRD
ncbi:hypothetical protein PG993_012179 [Apiospora rasikravindrae]|uniref:Uncharacterized protein n=1 Tax=Apiospora rasikravindrae TaxID=990691 RepID=A0ABR1S270_9PEZI